MFVRRSPVALGALACAVGLPLTSCAPPGRDDSVAAGFYALAWTTEQVAAGHWDVVNLTSPGAEPHDLELDIRTTALISEAPLIVLESGMQPAVDAAVRENATGEVIDAADVVTLRPSTDHASTHEAEHESEHGDENGDEHDGHDHGDLNPHFWLDPLLVADLADEVAARLADLDPEHEADYLDHAARTRTALEQLDQEYAEGLASCTRDTVVVTHDAFGYLEKYGLHVEPILGLSPDAEPTVAALARLKDLIRTEGVTTVFSEPLGSDQTASSLARSAGVKVGTLDPIEGPGQGDADSDYLSLMRTNLATLQEANDC